MPIVVEVKHPDLDVKQERRADALRVIGLFQSLPAKLRLLAFLDDQDAEVFRRIAGEHNRGFFIPLEGTQTGEWPRYLTEHLWARGSSQNCSARCLFDTVIYVHGTTCDGPVGRVMTFAHELQHFVQYGFNRDLWVRSKLFKLLLPAFEIPTEREARIVSKCIEEDLCGPEAVEEYVAKRINAAEKRIVLLKAADPPSPDKIKNWQDEVNDWRFIQEMDAPVFYDLAARTKLVFDRFPERKDEFEKTLRQWREESGPYSDPNATS
jgi:hypothetical protein